MDKPGRNDFCYCGSGQKYKKCHMPIDRAQEQELRQWEEAASWLRQDLIKYGKEERFAEAFAAGLALYWNNYYTFETAESMSMPEAFRYIDWFVFDYKHEGQPRLLETYHQEKHALLSVHQQKVLDAWMEVEPFWVYEMIQTDGQTLTLKDVDSGVEHQVYEASGKGEVGLGDWLITRLVPVRDRIEFSTTAAYLPQDEITELPQTLADARAAYQAEHPEADEVAFRHAHGHLIIHHALAQAELKGRPPVAMKDPSRQDKMAQMAAQQIQRMKTKAMRIRNR